MKELLHNSLTIPFALTVAVAACLYVGVPSEGAGGGRAARSGFESEAAPVWRRGAIAPYLEFARPRDTVYVLGDRYLDVSLQAQRVVVRYRNGDTFALPISSGNPSVRDGMATSSGIFSVQAKTPVALSKQFGNTKMLWWVGFNYNIGFHGLEANGYYRHLGKRPSSHGCLRMAREDAAELYKRARVGVPVIVRDTAPARVLAFADEDFAAASAFRLATPTRLWGKFTQTLMRKRLEYLLGGTRYVRQPFSVYLDGATALRPGGFETGDENALTLAQQKPVYFAATGAAAAQDATQRPARPRAFEGGATAGAERADSAAITTTRQP